MATQKCTVFITTTDGTTSTVVQKSSFTIGRAETSDVIILSTGVSRQHLQVYIRNGKIWVKDTGSSNGTRINGKRIAPLTDYVYQAGDLVELGAFLDKIKFDLEPLENDAAERPRKSRGNEFASDLPATIVSHVEKNERVSRFKTPEAPPRSFVNARPESTSNSKVSTRSEIDISPSYHSRMSPETEREVKEILSEARATAEKAQQKKQQAESEAHLIVEEAQKKGAMIAKDAQESAQKVLEEARRQANLMAQQTQEKANENLMNARKASNDLRLSAESEVFDMMQDARSQAARIREDAQREADQITHSAQERGLQTVEQAQDEAAELLRTARSHAVHVKVLAEKEANGILEKARSDAAQIKLDAKDEFEKILERARQRSEEIIQNYLEGSKAEVAELKAKALSDVEHERKAILRTAEEDIELLKQRVNSDLAAKLREKEQIDFEIQSIRDKNKAVYLENEKGNAENTRLLEEHEKIKEQVQQTRAELSNLTAQIKSEVMKAEAGLQEHEEELKSLLDKKTAAVDAKIEAESEEKKSKARLKEIEANINEGIKIQQEIERQKSNIAVEIQKERDRYKQEIEREGQAMRQQLVHEIKELRDKADKEYQERLKKEEDEIAQLRLKELDEFKSRRAEEEKLNKAMRKHQASEVSRLLEMAILPKIREVFKGQDIPEPLKTLPVDIANTVKRVMTDDDTPVVHELEKVIAFDAEKQKKQKKRFLVRGAIITSGLTMGIIWIFFPEVVVHVRQKIMSHLERGQAEMASTHRVKQKFTPNQTRDFKGSYAENVLYTTNYVDFKTNRDQQRWILELNKFFINDLGLNENTIVKFVAAESNLIQQLSMLKQEIDPAYEKLGIQKLQRAEQDALVEMRGIVGGERNFEKVRDFERNYFKKYSAQ